MSVVEAMQLGLIPVVTAVGEIAYYCSDGVNSLLVRDDAHTVASLMELLKNPEQARVMSQAAIDTWTEVPFYRNDVLAHSCQVLAST